MRISCFLTAETKIPIQETSVELFLKSVKNEDWAELVDSFRGLPEEEQKDAKSKLACVTLSGAFEKRNGEGLISHTKLVCMDFDIKHQTKETLDSKRGDLEEDKYTYSCFTSVSGKGLAVLVKTDSEPELYSSAYEQLSKYYKGRYDLIADPACKNLDRLRFITKDSGLRLNEGSSCFEVSKEGLSQEDRDELSKAGINPQVADNFQLHKERDLLAKQKTEALPPDLESVHNQLTSYLDTEKKEKTESKSKKSLEFESIYSDNDIIKLIQYLKATSTVLGSDTYKSWVRIAYALHTEFGEGGRSYFHDISGASLQYNPEICDKQFSSCAKSNQGKIHIGTIFYYAKDAGIDPKMFISQNNDLIVHAAVSAKGSSEGSRSAETVANMLEQTYGVSPDESNELIKKVFNRETPLCELKIAPVQRIMNLITSRYTDIKRNTLLGCVEVDGKPMSDRVFSSIVVDLKSIDRSISTQLIQEVISSDFVKEYDPLVDYFETRKENSYDEKFGLIQELSDSIISDTGTVNYDDDEEDDDDGFEKPEKTILNKPELKTLWLTKWLCGVIESVYGGHSPLTLILTGKQNNGKTQFFRRLLPKEIKKYYCEKKFHGTNDDIISLCQHLIVMDDECSGKSFKDIRAMKTITSTADFHVRRPYDRYPVTLRRVGVLCATSNEEIVIFDVTGNRRILPVRVIDIDKDKYNAIDKDLLFMQIYHLWKSGYKWEMNQKEIRDLSTFTSEHKAPDEYEELISEYFVSSQSYTESTGTHMSSTAIRGYLERTSQQKVKSLKDLGTTLKKMGFVRKSRKKGYHTATQGYIMLKKGFGL